MVAAAVGVTVGAAGCDSSPVAASVNGTLIKQAALRTQMRELASSSQFVRAWDASFSVPVRGTAPGTFSLAFSASTLAEMVTATALRQHLEAAHQTVAPDIYATVRGYYELTAAGWFQFSPALRDDLVASAADTIAVQPKPGDLSLAQQYLSDPARQAYFFNRVCVRTVTVTVSNGSGGVDFPASLAQAQQVRSQEFPASSATTLTPTPTTAAPVPGAPPPVAPPSPSPPTSAPPTTAASPVAPGSTAPGGATVCYSPAQLEQQGQQFFNTVVGLAPGQSTTPQRTSYGYNLVGVDSRQLLPFTPDVGKALIYSSPNLTQVSPREAVNRILATGHIALNPQFGRWDPTNPNGPTIVGPAVPTDVSSNLGFSLPPTSS